MIIDDYPEVEDELRDIWNRLDMFQMNDVEKVDFIESSQPDLQDRRVIDALTQGDHKLVHKILDRMEAKLCEP